MWFQHLIGFYFLFLSLNEHAKAELTGLDLNRVQLITAEDKPSGGRTFGSLQRSIYDVDDSDSSGLQRQGSPQKKIYDPSSRSWQTPARADETIKIYKPREDPKLYYSSKEFLQTFHRAKQGNKNSVGPEREGREHDLDNSLIPHSSEEQSSGESVRRFPTRIADESDDCVICPAEETLIPNPGEKKVLLETPYLENCSGKSAKGVRFIRMYGPKFGTLLTEGSHTVIGKIVNLKRKILQYCRFRVEVIPALKPECPVPVNLKADCDDNYPSKCSFTCYNGQLVGPQTQICLDGGKWNGNLPNCKARSSCNLNDLSAEHGEIGCNVEHGIGNDIVSQGSKCSIQCEDGFIPFRVRKTICRRGRWTHNLKCIRRVGE